MLLGGAVQVDRRMLGVADRCAEPDGAGVGEGAQLAPRGRSRVGGREQSATAGARDELSRPARHRPELTEHVAVGVDAARRCMCCGLPGRAAVGADVESLVVGEQVEGAVDAVRRECPSPEPPGVAAVHVHLVTAGVHGRPRPRAVGGDEDASGVSAVVVRRHPHDAVGVGRVDGDLAAEHGALERAHLDPGAAAVGGRRGARLGLRGGEVGLHADPGQALRCPGGVVERRAAREALVDERARGTRVRVGEAEALSVGDGHQQIAPGWQDDVGDDHLLDPL